MDTLLQRLSGLPPDRLAELCAELVEAEPRLYARVESALAIRYPIRPAPLPPLPFELTEVCGIAAMPDAPILCVALTEGERDIIHLLEVTPPQQPRLRATLRPDFLGESVGHMPLAVGEQSLYCLDTSEDPAIYRMDLKNAELLAAVRGPDAAAAVGMAKAPLHGLLYVAADTEMFVLDAFTLKKRRSFGRGTLERARDVAIAGELGDERLYVCDSSKPGRLLVFSLDGTPLEDVRGSWAGPWAICATAERLLIIEDAYSRLSVAGGSDSAGRDTTGGGTDTDATTSTYTASGAAGGTAGGVAGIGSRVLVLGLDGRTLEVYEPPQSIPEIVVHMCLIAGGRTTPPMLACISGSDEGVYGPRHSLALVAGV